MVRNRRGKVLIRNLRTEAERWVYPVDGQELISSAPAWVFVTPAEYQPKQEAAPAKFAEPKKQVEIPKAAEKPVEAKPVKEKPSSELKPFNKPEQRVGKVKVKKH